MGKHPSPARLRRPLHVVQSKLTRCANDLGCFSLSVWDGGHMPFIQQSDIYGAWGPSAVAKPTGNENKRFGACENAQG